MPAVLPSFTFLIPFVTFLALADSAYAAAPFATGEVVRLTRGEMLQFKGADLAGAGKGQVFTVLKHGSAQAAVFVGFINKEGEMVAVSAPAEAFEAMPPTPWSDLLAGVEAFRDGRTTEMKTRLTNATKDEQLRPIAGPLALRLNAAISTAALAAAADATSQALARTLGELRETSEKLVTLGYASLALPLEQGLDRLAAQSPAPASGVPAKLNHDELTKTVAASARALMLARQALGSARGFAASEQIEAALKLEPARPDLKALQAKVQQDIKEAGERCDDAVSMRRFAKGAVHALTAIEMGTKLCADHPRLRALRKEMEALFEERTAPPVNSAFLAAAHVAGSADALAAGHKIYTTRCAECHELELLDSRDNEGWQKAVGSMAGRAHLSAADQGRILAYLAAARTTLKSE